MPIDKQTPTDDHVDAGEDHSHADGHTHLDEHVHSNKHATRRHSEVEPSFGAALGWAYCLLSCSSPGALGY
jgi:hypothetical protein